MNDSRLKYPGYRVPVNLLTGILIAGALSAFAPPARSQDIRISTILDCGEWTGARKKSAAVNFEHYLQGFLDGFSLASKLDFWGSAEANRLTPALAFNRMDEYCRLNPKGNTLDGAHKLFTDRRQELTAAPKKPEEKKKR